jgi:putative two-component system response regulator
MTPRILVVDDEAPNLQLLRLVLQDTYRLLFAKDGTRAIELARQELPDLILLDVMMPGMTGYEACRRLKADPATAHIPVIFVTALADSANELDGLTAGAVDYITKPVSAAIVQARVRTHLSLVRMEELRRSRLELVRRLGRAGEHKDNETGLHVIRMSHHARMLGLAAGMSAEEADDLFAAAPLHDIGKIGIPDRILLKPGPLDAAEWEVMRGHTLIGADIIGEHASGLLEIARRIALSHHEKWDGSGYPHGLAGEAIPLEGRIVALADVFDALTSARPYKKAWPLERALAHLRAESGRHFDPTLVELFLARMPEVIETMARWAETPAALAPCAPPAAAHSR